VERLLSLNHDLCQRIVEAALEYYGVDGAELEDHIKAAKRDGRPAEKVSVSQALKHIVRDWSQEGAGERGDAFPCLLSAIDGLFPGRETADGPVKVLFPGAGLGRLGHEVSALGGRSLVCHMPSMPLSWSLMYKSRLRGHQ
jgi:hypothetical protein